MYLFVSWRHEEAPLLFYNCIKLKGKTEEWVEKDINIFRYYSFIIIMYFCF